MTALTLFLNQSASATAGTADQLLENASTGGTLSNKNTNLVSGTTGWITLYAQGNATGQTGAGSQPALADNGWIDDAVTLVGNHFPAGTWSVSLGFETTTTGTFVADFHFRFYQRSSGGTRTLIGEAVASAQTIISTSYTVLTPSVSASAGSTFVTGDKAGCDVTINITTNGTTGNLRMQASSSATLGNTSAQIVTPGYISVTTSSRTIPSTAVLITTNSRTVTSTAALITTSSRAIPSAAALLTTSSRTIPATADIALTHSRTIPATACLDQPVSRTIPATAALLTTNIRTIPTTATLTNTFTRVIPTSAVLYVPAVFYASNVTQSIGGLTQSDQMSQVPGGTETSVAITMPSSGTNTYIELVSQGGTPGSTSSLPAPTGKGWSLPLQGYTILAGSWFSAFTLAKSGLSMSGASLFVRWYRRTMDGTYHPIGTSTLTSQTFSTKATYTTPTVTVNFPWQFINGDTLYMDAFVLNPTTAWASDVFTVYISNSATQGVYNDGIIVAPTVISTPAGLSCLLGASAFQTGTTSPIKNESFTLANAADQRSVLNLIIEDEDSTLSYTPNMPVILSDSIQGKLYDGYLASDQKSKVSADPNNLQREHKLTCADHHRDYDKESNGIAGTNTNGTNYSNWTAGDIVCDFIDKVQVDNGIWGEFAIEADYSQSAFAQGTLSGTTATSTTSPFTYAPNVASPPITTNTGDLELTRAGSQFTLVEQTTSDFASGTLTNMVASNNELTPTTQKAVRFVAQFPLSVAASNQGSAFDSSINNPETISNYASSQIWSGSTTLGSSDTLNYDIWISSTSPAFMAGIELLFSDGSLLSDKTYGVPDNLIGRTGYSGVWDQNNVSADFLNDLSAYTKDAWYTRQIPLSVVSGKTITGVSVKVTGSSAGTYTVYVKNIYLTSAPGSPFFSTSATVTQLNPPTVTTRGGYIPYGVTDVVQVYQPALSTRVSPAHSISSVGLVQDSTISWTASLPAVGTFTDIIYPPGTTTPNSGSSQGVMLIYISYDTTTWLLCTNQTALPGLPPGANVAGLSFYLMEQFQAALDPTALPSLLQVNVTINSAAAQTTSDVVAVYGNSTEWNTGTFNGTAVSGNGDLINGGTYTPSWSTFNWTQWAVGSHVNQSHTISTLTISDTADTGSSAATLSLDDVLPLTDGTIECDVSTAAGGSNQWSRTGILYRAANWLGGWNTATPSSEQYVPDTDGYVVYIQYDTTGTNVYLAWVVLNPTGTPSYSSTYATTINSGTTYHIKVTFTGNRHRVYWNGGTTPVIDILDDTYATAGRVGLYALGTIGSSSTCNFTSKWSNYTCTPLAVGTWTSSSISLSSLVTCGYTQMAWSEIAANGASQSTAVVLTSLNSGSTWQQCQNGAEIPLLPPGTSVSSLLIRIILYANTYLTTPTITGLYARVCGSYGTVSGTRISPALSLTPVGYVASSNVAYHANIPTNTSVAVATSQDKSTWTTVGGSGAGASPGYWTNQPSATQDLFNTVTSANYTNTSKSGGSTATATYDTTDSRITLAGGSGALYLNNAINCADIDFLVDMDESDAGGLCWHVVNTSNYYELGVYDASSSGGFTNQLRLYKVSSGTRTLLGSASTITFTRNTFHRIRVKMKGGLINVYWDGACKQSYLDTSPLGSGQVGLRNDGGTSRYYQLWVQPLGTNLSGQVVYLKTTLTTSDPSQMPQVFTQLCCVRGPSIGTGATIESLHPPTLPFAAYYSAEVDAITQESGDWYWLVNEWRQFRFQARQARPGAFPVQANADPAGNYSGYLLYQPPLGFPPVSVTNSADPLRNIQVMTNVSGLVSPPPVALVADGNTTSWTLGYPVYSAPVILVNGQAATIGVSGIDSGQQFYWQPGSTSLTYDSSLPKLPAGTIINVTYTGQSTVNTVVSNSAAIAAQAALELNSGRIVEIESALTFNPDGTSSPNGMSSTQATTFAQGLLNRFGNNNPSELIGTTLYSGLQPGTVIPAFIPSLDLWNTQLPISKVTTTAFLSPNGVIYLYSVDCTNGANVSQWQRVWF